ncbi:unnamed protein product [Spodoptera exigua]|nr:unnamed protein product [Spodoptera exigua]
MADKIKVKSNFDMKGNYEPSDSEDEYTPKERRLLEKVRKRKHDDSESEEEMYAFSESGDSDNEKDDLGIADSDVEGQEQSDDDLPDSKAWGKKKRSYYATDYVDEDYGGFDRILLAVRNNLELHVTEIRNQKNDKKRKSGRASPESKPKKLKLLNAIEKDEGEDTGVSDDEDQYEGNDLLKTNQDIDVQRNNDESEESGFSDNDVSPNEIETEDNKPSTSSQDIVPEDVGEKREITYQIAKNKGLTPHRKKDQRNPRVKHKLKYRKAKIRRKGAVREPRTEITRYAGEASGIKANVKKSIKIK